MRKIIINADDLGISDYVDSQIEECIKLGVITSSTLMANAPSFEDGVRVAKKYPEISIGVHLNIVEFAPLTNIDVFKKHGIVGEDGNYIEGAINVMPIDDELKKAIFEEWDAQISKIEASGIIPTHIDSHEHTHTIIGLKDVLCKVMNKHGIKRVRRKIIPSIRFMLRIRKHPDPVKLDKGKAVVPKRQNVFYRRFRLIIEIIQSIRWNRQMSKRFSMTDGFCAFRYFYSYRCISTSCRTAELMCHPGHISYQVETDSLMNDTKWQKDFAITTYNEI